MKKLLGLLLAMTMLFTGFALAEDTATGLTQDIVVLRLRGAGGGARHPGKEQPCAAGGQR